MPTPPADAGVPWSRRVTLEVGRHKAPLMVGVGARRRCWGVSRRGTTRPLLGDDRVKLRPEELLVRAHQLEELLFHTLRSVEWDSGDRGHGDHYQVRR